VGASGIVAQVRQDQRFEPLPSRLGSELQKPGHPLKEQKERQARGSLLVSGCDDDADKLCVD